MSSKGWSLSIIRITHKRETALNTTTTVEEVEEESVNHLIDIYTMTRRQSNSYNYSYQHLERERAREREIERVE